MSAPSCADRLIKRSISLHEKATLAPQRAKHGALIMIDAAGTELDELEQIGFDFSRIVVAECNQRTFERLNEHYGYPLHWWKGYVEEYMKQAPSGDTSYVHLDYTGYLDERWIDSMTRWTHILTPRARVRLTFSQCFRDSDLAMNHSVWQWKLARFWSQIGLNYDPYDIWRWCGIENYEMNSDATRLYILMLMTQLMFGIEGGQLKKIFEPGAPQLPTQVPQARCYITNFKRIRYKSMSSSRNWMETVWVDIAPMPVRGAAWTFDRMYKVMSQLHNPPVEKGS